MRISNLEDKSWGVVLEDFDFSCNDYLITLRKLISDSHVVVIKGCSLRPEHEKDICEKIGTLEQLPPEIFYRCPVVDGQPYPFIQRVTGRLDKNKKATGLFGHKTTLDWHANRASAFNERKSYVWLYAKELTEGSVTSWANMEKVLEDLPDDIKIEISRMKAYFGYVKNKYTVSEDFREHESKYPLEIVRTHKFTGRKYLYLPFLQLTRFEGMTTRETRNYLNKIIPYIENEKNVYHHSWQNGDIVISDQWTTIHKRWPYENEKRLLHRITFDLKL